MRVQRIRQLLGLVLVLVVGLVAAAGESPAPPAKSSMSEVDVQQVLPQPTPDEKLFASWTDPECCDTDAYCETLCRHVGAICEPDSGPICPRRCYCDF